MKAILNGTKSLSLMSLLLMANAVLAAETTALNTPAAATTPVVATIVAPSADQLFVTGQDSYKQHDFKTAADLFKKSADLGNPDAQYTYALMLYRGQGFASSDYSEAARYYILAANNNFAKAQYNLAILYYQGTGVARDDVQAYKWLVLASQKGEKRALDMLPVAERNLSPEVKAQALTDLQAPKHPTEAGSLTYAF